MSLRWMTIPLFLLFFWLAVSSLVDDSPTFDEQNHIARGIAFVRTGEPKLSMEHPPLINALSALPLLTFDSFELPLDEPSWQREPIDFFWYLFADSLFWRLNPPDLIPKIVFVARVPIVLLTTLLGAFVYRFSVGMWHRSAGILSLSLLLLDPNIIAHGRYSTTDMGGTVMLLLAFWLLWRLWTAPKGKRALRFIASAIGLGMAFASKLSILGFVIVFAVLAVLPIHESANDWRGAIRRLMQFLMAGFCSIFVVWAIFGFEFGPFIFVDEPLEQFNRFSGPMPTFWAGIERIAFATGVGRQSFLLGQYSLDGFSTYFPIAFVLKTPLPTLILLVVGVGVLIGRKSTRQPTLFLLAPAILYFILTLQSGLNIGYRHLLPMLPMLYVMLGGLMPKTSAVWMARWRRVGAGLAVFGLAIGTLTIHPHYLSFFNVAAGGPTNGPNLLADSNIDWGQDLFRLQKWMESNEVEKVNLSYFGSVEPWHYLFYDPLPGEKHHRDLWFGDAVPFDTENPAAGVYAISVHNLLEMPHNALGDKTVFAYFRNREPDDTIGYAINIYIIP